MDTEHIKHKQREYLQACLVGDLEAVVYMVKNENKKMKSNQFMNKCLNVACQKGHTEIVKYLLEKVEWEEYDIRHAHISSILGGHIPVSDIMTQRMYSLGKFDDIIEWWRESLEGACKNGHIDIFKYYERIMNAIKYDTVGFAMFLNGCLFKACWSGCVEMVNYIISRGAKDWNMGLHGACMSKNRYLINLMINYGANRWFSGLRGACTAGDMEMVIFMMEKIKKTENEAEIMEIKKAEEGWIWNIVFTDACNGGNLEIVKYITENSNSAITCWHIGLLTACEYGYVDIAKFMVQKGAANAKEALIQTCAGSEESRDKYPHIIIDEDKHAYLESRALDIVKFLVPLCVDLSDCLYYSCGYGSLEITQVLINSGATDFNQGLKGACSGNRIDLVKLMIEYGATDFNGGLRTNLEADSDIINLLLSHGANNYDKLIYVDEIKLHGFYCNVKGVETKIDTKYLRLLKEYPPYVFLVGSKYARAVRNRTPIARLPIELIRQLFMFV